ncbi:hypothetical protein [Lewinella sp. W8]|uniref:hypothetical protein n=1 Tax=Lewinella sp. W8 TaxID=2528208 RepID=UPI0010682B50|nr:hypothetical protein [Lewinella sp. W8]MTB53599.1 hypothetical protein [Lewinella sp. W8]
MKPSALVTLCLLLVTMMFSGEAVGQRQTVHHYSAVQQPCLKNLVIRLYEHLPAVTEQSLALFLHFRVTAPERISLDAYAAFSASAGNIPTEQLDGLFQRILRDVPLNECRREIGEKFILPVAMADTVLWNYAPIDRPDFRKVTAAKRLFQTYQKTRADDVLPIFYCERPWYWSSHKALMQRGRMKSISIDCTVPNCPIHH